MLLYNRSTSLLTLLNISMLLKTTFIDLKIVYLAFSIIIINTKRSSYFALIGQESFILNLLQNKCNRLSNVYFYLHILFDFCQLLTFIITLWINRIIRYIYNNAMCNFKYAQLEQV